MQGPAAVSSPSADVIPGSYSHYVWFVATVAALGGLLFGYDWVVIGGARQFYEVYFHLTTAAQVGWANSCALLGCLIGSVTAGYTADRYGRRRLLIVSAVLFAASSIATGWAYSFAAFIVWRIAGGIAIGLASNISPIYIAEISPAAIRGRLVSLNQFAIVVGILLAQVVNVLIARSETGAGQVQAHLWNLEFGWRWMFTAVSIPSVLFFAGAVFLPESPRWLVSHGDAPLARRVLRRFGDDTYAEAEFKAINESVLQASSTHARWGDLFQSRYRRILALGAGLAVLQQWTGINILFNYASEVYRSAGYGTNEIFLNIVITGSINLIATILAMFLVDTLGRRKLMLLGCLGIATSHLLCAFAYQHHYLGLPILLLTLAAIACYALTLAPVTWVLISEIFPNRVRSHGVSAAVSVLWIASFALTYTFPWLEKALGAGGVFRIYGLVCFAGFLLVLAAVKETRGESLERLGQQ